MGVHLEPIVFTVRVFLEGGTFGDPYDAICTLQRAGNIGYVSACHGRLNHRVVTELETEAAKFGMQHLEWRRGKDV